MSISKKNLDEIPKWKFKLGDILEKHIIDHKAKMVAYGKIEGLEAVNDLLKFSNFDLFKQKAIKEIIKNGSVYMVLNFNEKNKPFIDFLIPKNKFNFKPFSKNIVGTSLINNIEYTFELNDNFTFIKYIDSNSSKQKIKKIDTNGILIFCILINNYAFSGEINESIVEQFKLINSMSESLAMNMSIFATKNKNIAQSIEWHKNLVKDFFDSNNFDDSNTILVQLFENMNNISEPISSKWNDILKILNMSFKYSNVCKELKYLAINKKDNKTLDDNQFWNGHQSEYWSQNVLNHVKLYQELFRNFFEKVYKFLGKYKSNYDRKKIILKYDYYEYSKFKAIKDNIKKIKKETKATEDNIKKIKKKLKKLKKF